MLLSWVIVFLVIAIIAGVLGFGGIAQESAWIAKILFFVFLVLFFILWAQNQGWIDTNLNLIG